MRYIEHQCTQGDRWDLIAFRYYGSGQHTRILMRANPNYLGQHTFKGGERIRIPVQNEPYTAASIDHLPAWKR